MSNVRWEYSLGACSRHGLPMGKTGLSDLGLRFGEHVEKIATDKKQGQAPVDPALTMTRPEMRSDTDTDPRPAPGLSRAGEFSFSNQTPMPTTTLSREAAIDLGVTIDYVPAAGEAQKAKPSPRFSLPVGKDAVQLARELNGLLVTETHHETLSFYDRYQDLDEGDQHRVRGYLEGIAEFGPQYGIVNPRLKAVAEYLLEDHDPSSDALAVAIFDTGVKNKTTPALRQDTVRPQVSLPNTAAGAQACLNHIAWEESGCGKKEALDRFLALPNGYREQIYPLLDVQLQYAIEAAFKPKVARMLEAAQTGGLEAVASAVQDLPPKLAVRVLTHLLLKAETRQANRSLASRLSEVLFPSKHLHTGNAADELLAELPESDVPLPAAQIVVKKLAPIVGVLIGLMYNLCLFTTQNYAWTFPIATNVMWVIDLKNPATTISELIS